MRVVKQSGTMSAGLVLGFECEWYDEISNQLHTLFLKFFLDDNTIEILGTQRHLLKRIFYPSVTASDLFRGNSITVYNRVITIISYANTATTKYMEAREVHMLCVVHESAKQQIGDILALAKDYDMVMGKIRTASYDMPAVEALKGDFLIELVGYSGQEGVEPFLKALSQYGEGVGCMGMAVPDMLAFFKQKFVTHVSDDEPATLCLIKPHVMKERKEADLLNAIVKEGYVIKAVHSAHMTNTIAEELFDAYREIFPKYTVMIEHMCVAPALAVMVTHSSFALVENFREFSGPLNPELAATLRPASLRATFGKSYAENAVHCTDLAEDAHMECRYFFETLAGL